MVTSRTSIWVPGTLDPNRIVAPSSGWTRITTAFWPKSSSPWSREEQVRCALEHDGDLRHPAAQPLAGAQVERRPGPAPGVDVHPDRGERLGLGIGRDALFLQVAQDLLAALPAAGELPAGGVGGEVLGEPDGGEDLFLLGTQVIGVEGDRLFHGRQGQQLQQVVLDDVAGRAHAVVVAGPAAGADVLGHGDLDVVHIVGVPERLEELVGEAQCQDVLHRLLAQVVVDPEHRVRREHRFDDVVELPGRFEVVPERLFDHHAAPVVARGLGQAVLGELAADLLEGLRRDREVERVVAPRAALLVELIDRVAEPLERLVVVELALHEADALGELLPDRFVERGAGVGLDGLLDLRGEVLVLPLAGGQSPPGRSSAAAARGWRGHTRPA